MCLFKNIRLQYLLIAVLLCTGCEREQDIVLPDVTVDVLNYDGNAIIQEPDGDVTIDIYMQSLAGIKQLDILVNDVQQESISPESPLSYNYTFTYTIPAAAMLGDVYEIVFKATDNQGRVKESRPVNLLVNYPFTIDAFTFEGETYQRLKGRVNRDVTLTKDKSWLIDSIVTVDKGTVLTIEEGTTVYFRTFDNQQLSLLSLHQGSKINAIGTREEPIVFTSSKVKQNAASPGDWGGLLIHGEAPTNVGTSVLYGGFRYGGNKPADNSGTLRYLRIEYAGKDNPANGTQLHGLQLFGVGSATNISYIEVYKCYNNAFRLRGGRVSLRYIAGIEHGGYGIWADEGWQGNGQFWLFQTGIQATLVPVNYWNIARSLEFRNDDVFYDKQPRTTFRLSNVTLIGNGYTSGTDGGTRRGVRIRTGAQGFLYNTIVTGFPSNGVSVEDLEISTLGTSTILRHMHAYNNALNWDAEANTFFYASGEYNLSETPVSGINLDNFAATAPSTYNPTGMGSWFINAPYIGAVDPASDWTKGGIWFKNKSGNFR